MKISANRKASMKESDRRMGFTKQHHLIAIEQQICGFVQMRMRQKYEELSSLGKRTLSKTYPTDYKISKLRDAVALLGDLPIIKCLFAVTSPSPQ